MAGTPRAHPQRRSPEIAIPFLSSLFAATMFVTLALQGLDAPLEVLAPFLVFVALFAATAALVWRGSRVGYIVGIVASLLVLFLFSGAIQAGLTSFANLASFGTVILTVPALIMTIVYSAFGMAGAMRKATPGQRRTLPVASTLAILTVGFVIGSLFVGALASGAVLALGQSANTSANVTIVVGATNSGVAAPFSPANYTTKAGSTITWVNKDTIAHTVASTSVPAGASAFSSGLIQYGNTYSVTLTVPGTYKYECSLHPFMTGTVTVTS